ncbi:hypothetical protein NL676_004008 [Syzygium grande]|nr:hypothetical protein NL676_004008 [Syzygium grande]
MAAKSTRAKTSEMAVFPPSPPSDHHPTAPIDSRPPTPPRPKNPKPIGRASSMFRQHRVTCFVVSPRDHRHFEIEQQ